MNTMTKQQVIDILRAQAKKTVSREALMALEAVEGEVVKADSEEV